MWQPARSHQRSQSGSHQAVLLVVDHLCCDILLEGTAYILIKNAHPRSSLAEKRASQAQQIYQRECGCASPVRTRPVEASGSLECHFYLLGPHNTPQDLQFADMNHGSDEKLFKEWSVIKASVQLHCSQTPTMGSKTRGTTALSVHLWLTPNVLREGAVWMFPNGCQIRLLS